MKVQQTSMCLKNQLFASGLIKRSALNLNLWKLRIREYLAVHRTKPKQML